jgi:protein-S-isoprenylcysteine O-methyltransferase Ste14
VTAGVALAAGFPRISGAGRVLRLSANLVGAAGAAYFADVSLRAFLQTHQPIGAAFLVEQTLVVLAYLVRRPARVVTRRYGDWLLAFGGTFVPALLRPGGAQAAWGYHAGLVLQILGLSICISSFLMLGRSFGFAAGDRGLVQAGPYGLVRHPIYASYLFLQVGYLLQSMSVRNLAVVLVAMGCDAGRALAEDRMLAGNPAHAAYRRRVRWRLVPGVW